MSDFSADWLAMREPADRAARAALPVDVLLPRLARAARPTILDLATGTGANLRYLAPRLPGPQTWRVVDRDGDLLAQLPQRIGAWAISAGHIVTGDARGFRLRSDAFECRVEPRASDLSRLAPHLFEGVGLVTASALLDLVSERWIRALANCCRTAGASVLFALSYNGRIGFSPAEPDDEFVRTLVNRHQRTSKGFGRALGPDAAPAMTRALEEAGYETVSAPSDWRLGPTQAALQRALIDGWVSAAVEIEPGHAEGLAGWQARRLAHVDSGLSELVVGHDDVAGWVRDPPG